MTKPTLSNSKIIMLVMFICATIMTSLFIFHLNNKPAANSLAPEVGVLFSDARDIKSFELFSSADNQKFTQKNFYGHWTLLFFGFTHCASICPSTLDLMSRVYDQLHTNYPSLQVVLISLDPERDSPEALLKYTQSFNPAFIGVSGKIQELRKLQSQLGVYSARDTATSGDNYQIQHTASIMLINPQGKWAGMFKFGLKPDVLVTAVKGAIG